MSQLQSSLKTILFVYLTLWLWSCALPITFVNESGDATVARGQKPVASETMSENEQLSLVIEERQIIVRTPPPPPVHVANENPLTGLLVYDPKVFMQRPLQVRLGNDPQVRSQLNLTQADIVYEEIVEWWITRLTAIYYTKTPEIIGPIRSARLINIPLAQQYQAALIHSGGSDPVRFQVAQSGIVDLDEYFHPTPYFYRPGESWQRRLAVNAQAVHQYLAAQGWQAPVSLRGFAFQDEPPEGEQAERIFIDYPATTSKVQWLFDETSQKYHRYVADQLMIDTSTGEIVSADNVVIYFTKHYQTDIIEDSTGATSVGIDLNGEGVAWIVRDKVLIKGRWLTDGTQTPLFLDEADNHIPLRRGQTWVQVVPLDYVIGIN